MPTNIEIIRAAYEAFMRRDLDTVLATFAPDIEWTHPDGMNAYGLGGTKRGHGEVREFMKRVPHVFAELRPDPKEFVVSGGRVVVFGTHHMRAPHGATCTVRFVQSWTMVGGRATHFEDFFDASVVIQLLNGSTGNSSGNGSTGADG